MSISNTYQRLKARFKAQTPAKWRKFGEHLMSFSTGVALPPGLLGFEKIALSIFCIGLIGRLLVEFTQCS